MASPSPTASPSTSRPRCAASPGTPRRSTRSTTRSRPPAPVRSRPSPASPWAWWARSCRGTSRSSWAAWKVGPALAPQLDRPQALREVAAHRNPHRGARGRGRACRTAYSTCCRATATPPGRRSRCTWTWTASASRAPPAPASACSSTLASRTQARLARVRWQVAQHRPRGLSGRRTRRRGRPRPRSSSTREQMCSAGSLLIVEERVRDELLERVVAAGRRMQPGDPLDPSTTLARSSTSRRPGRCWATSTPAAPRVRGLLSAVAACARRPAAATSSRPCSTRCGPT